jgi:polyribonucleotide nucleotidyltransferase|tara:strand:+ start:6799 stop:7158 length:360 start_codon:yes stop_codon:yes gene_type:complete
MLELGPRELLTLGTVLAGLAATWGVLKATIKSIVGQLNDIKSDVTKIYQQVDNQEANQAVLQNSIKIISQDILSPQILKAQSERDGRNEERIRILEERMNRMVSMHNGIHPPTTTKEHD